MKIKSTFILILLLLLFFLALFYIKPRKTYQPSGIAINKTLYPITGIDLSHHSGHVDFRKLKQSNIDFIFLKTSEGENLVDSHFEKNYQNALKNEFVVGFYHFYKFTSSPEKQATFFIEQVTSKKHRLPLVVDIEEWGNQITKPKTEIIKDIRTFVDYVHQKTHLDVMIYTNESGYYTYIQKEFPKNDIWICSFKQGTKIENKWLFWQHSHKGKLEAIEGWVDINTFHGDKKTWEQYLIKHKKSF